MSEFKDKVIVITGASHGIGKCIAEEFSKEGAKVYTIDINDGCTFKGDIGKKETLEEFAKSK